MPISNDVFLGEIYIAAFGFAPKGCALCNGQLMPINQNQALFSILGTTYGGNGQTNFALPNFQGITPNHVGNGHFLGEHGGELSHTLQIGEVPAHTHALNAVKEFGSSPNPSNNRLATATGMMGNAYGSASNLTAMAAASVGATGGSQPHDNTQPSLALNFYICLQGLFPTRN